MISILNSFVFASLIGRAHAVLRSSCRSRSARLLATEWALTETTPDTRPIHSVGGHCPRSRNLGAARTDMFRNDPRAQRDAIVFSCFVSPFAGCRRARPLGGAFTSRSLFDGLR